MIQCQVNMQNWKKKNFGGFIERRLKRFEFEKSPLHTKVYGGTGTGKTYFV